MNRGSATPSRPAAGLGGTCLPVDEAMDTDAADDSVGSGGGSAGSDGPGDTTVGVDGTGDAGRGTTEDSGPIDTSVGDDDDDDDDDDSAPPVRLTRPAIDSNACADPDDTCIEPDLEEVCAPPCGSFKDCPIPAGVDIVPVCTDKNSSVPGVCILPCQANSDCPDPLECIEDDIGLYGGVGGGELCAWD